MHTCVQPTLEQQGRSGCQPLAGENPSITLQWPARPLSLPADQAVPPQSVFTVSGPTHFHPSCSGHPHTHTLTWTPAEEGSTVPARPAPRWVRLPLRSPLRGSCNQNSRPLSQEHLAPASGRWWPLKDSFSIGHPPLGNWDMSSRPPQADSGSSHEPGPN